VPRPTRAELEAARALTVPDVTGQDKDDARKALEAKGFEVDTNTVDGGGQKDSVLSTDPAAGTQAQPGSKVTMNVSKGNQQNQQVATQQVNELLTAPDAKVYATTMNGAPVSFVVSKARDQALFLGDDIPAPVDGKVYQLWMIGSSEITPNALVDHGGDVDAGGRVDRAASATPVVAAG